MFAIGDAWALDPKNGDEEIIPNTRRLLVGPKRAYTCYFFKSLKGRTCCHTSRADILGKGDIICIMRDRYVSAALGFLSLRRRLDDLWYPVKQL